MAADSCNLASQEVHPLAEFRAYITKADHQSLASVDRGDMTCIFPLVVQLVDPVYIQVLDEREDAAQHILGDGKAVAA